MIELLPGYFLRSGSGLDRALLVKFMQRTYQELYPGHSFAHLAQTVDRYISDETPLWWVYSQEGAARTDANEPVSESPTPLPVTLPHSRAPIACLWLGNAVDQVSGARHAYVFLLYVCPEARRQGIGSALMRHAETWAKARGDRQLGLQVFQHNQPAVNLYTQLGYQPQSLWMVKSLNDQPE